MRTRTATSRSSANTSTPLRTSLTKSKSSSNSWRLHMIRITLSSKEYPKFSILLPTKIIKLTSSTGISPKSLTSYNLSITTINSPISTRTLSHPKWMTTMTIYFPPWTINHIPPPLHLPSIDKASTSSPTPPPTSTTKTPNNPFANCSIKIETNQKAGNKH